MAVLNREGGPWCLGHPPPQCPAIPRMMSCHPQDDALNAGQLELASGKGLGQGGH